VIHILTGPVHSGKTTLLRDVTTQLKNQNIDVAGFLCLYTEENAQFIRKEGNKFWQRIGPYFFIPESLDHAQNMIRLSTNADVCVVDEVGPLELEGKGLWPALKKVIALSTPEFIFVVRETILDNWHKMLKEIPVQVFDISDKALHQKMAQYFIAKFRDREKVKVQ
jgi:nucleoside-triphosphatase THEP1